MRRLLTAFLLLMVCGQGAFADPSVKHVAAYIKLWGYLKYFHSRIVTGQVDWDSAFVADVKLAEDAATFPTAVEHLLRSAGNELPYGRVPPKDSVFMLTDLSWRDDASLFTADQTSALHHLYSDKLPRHTRYVSQDGAGNANFDGESTGDKAGYPDEPHRLLALARHWNAIEYFYPDLDLIPSWADTLAAYLPRIGGAKDSIAYQLGMLAYCCSIRDGHSVTYSTAMDRLRGLNILPLALTSIGRLLVFRKLDVPLTLPFHPGDVLKSIGGKDVDELVRNTEAFVPRSNDAGMMQNICMELGRCVTSDSVLVTYESADGSLHRAKVKPQPIGKWMKMVRSDTTGSHWKLLKNNIGYVDLSKLRANEVAPAMKELAPTKAIIFDVRDYPQGIVWTLFKSLKSKGSWAKIRMPFIRCPGRYVQKMQQSLDSSRDSGTFDQSLYSGKVVVLVNEETFSQGEYTAMMLRQIEGALVVGSETAGADGEVSQIKLPGGITTRFSGLGVYWPDGRPTQRIGIVPDVEVHPTIEGVRAGRDEVLEKAVEVCRE